ncbi:MAG: hypothetical protein WKF96_08855 [Solirubrobacteraceae bacterium]
MGGGAGGLKLRKAKRSVAEKREELEISEMLTAKRRAECESAFSSLGLTKIQAMEQGLVPFQQAFSRLQNVDLQVDVDEEGAPPIDQVRVTDAGRLTLATLDAIGGLAVAGAAGAAAYTGTLLGVVGAGATAGTGAAIGGLSGAAATNATLAWLGGGTLAAGGGGMAAGAMVLSGIAAAPALVVGGAFLYKKGSEAMAKAETFASDVDSARAKHREAQTVLRAATGLAVGVGVQINRLLPWLSRETGWLEATVDIESDWTALDDTRRERIRAIAVVAVAISDLVHTPVVDENGALTKAIQAAYARGQVVAGGLA